MCLLRGYVVAIDSREGLVTWLLLSDQQKAVCASYGQLLSLTRVVIVVVAAVGL